MEAGGDINRNNRFSRPVDEINSLAIGSSHDGGQPSAKQRINEDITGGEEGLHLVGRPESYDRCLSRDLGEATIHDRGIAIQVGDRCEEYHANSSMPAMQQSSHNQSISSVISFSTDDGNGLASCRPTVFLQIFDNSLAGSLHQNGAGDTGFDDSAAIEYLHISSRDDLHWRPCVRGRCRMENRVNRERKEICCLHRIVMTRATLFRAKCGGHSGSTVQFSKAFISLTAWSRPTRTARAIMLWPMLYSAISGMCVSRVTLR